MCNPTSCKLVVQIPSPYSLCCSMIWTGHLWTTLFTLLDTHSTQTPQTMMAMLYCWAPFGTILQKLGTRWDCLFNLKGLRVTQLVSFGPLMVSAVTQVKATTSTTLHKLWRKIWLGAVDRGWMDRLQWGFAIISCQNIMDQKDNTGSQSKRKWLFGVTLVIVETLDFGRLLQMCSYKEPTELLILQPCLLLLFPYN